MVNSARSANACGDDEATRLFVLVVTGASSLAVARSRRRPPRV